MPGHHFDLRSLEPDRVCLIKPSALGDIVHATPVLSALCRRWPNARIAWVVNASLRGLLDGHPDLDEVIPFDRSALRLGRHGFKVASRFLADLRRRRFDLTIDLQGLLRSGLMSWATGAPIRVGRADAREGATWFYTHRIAATEPHAVDRLLRIAEAFGAEAFPPRFQAIFSDADRHWARAMLAEVPRPRLVLNVGARWITKRWPPEHFAEIGRRATSSFGAGLVAVGAPEDRPLVEALRRRLDPTPVLDLCGQTTLPQLAAIASESDLFLSNDTGPLHLACATGARVLGVFTCTDPDKTGPYGPNASVIRSGIWCARSCRKTCDRLECMAELTPDRVWPLVARLLIRERLAC